MDRLELGSFKAGSKEYKLRYRLGYGKYKEVIYIGNTTYGHFLRFHKDEENVVYLFVPRTRDFSIPRDNYGEVKGNHTTGVLGLHIPKSNNDLKIILKMILKPRGIKIINLNFESREKLKEYLFKYLIVERLTK